MTVKQALKLFDFDEIFEEIIKIYPDQHGKKESYKKAVNILKKLEPKSKPTISRIEILEQGDEDFNVYFTSRLKNKYYIKPPSGFKPYGGKYNDEGDVPPVGNYYNINCARYNKYMAIGPVWDQYVNIELHCDYSDLTAIAAFLFELTFHGFSPKECQDFFKGLDENQDSWHTHK